MSEPSRMESALMDAPEVGFTNVWKVGCDIERELNAANDRIRLLIAERDTARQQSDQKVSLREEFRELLGTDDIEQGITVVCDLKQLAAVRLGYIKQLETDKEAANERIKRLEDSYAAKDAQLSNLLNICLANGIDVSSQDLIHGKEAKL